MVAQLAVMPSSRFESEDETRAAASYTFRKGIRAVQVLRGLEELGLVELAERRRASLSNGPNASVSRKLMRESREVRSGNRALANFSLTVVSRGPVCDQTLAWLCIKAQIRTEFRHRRGRECRFLGLFPTLSYPLVLRLDTLNV